MARSRGSFPRAEIGGTLIAGPIEGKPRALQPQTPPPKGVLRRYGAWQAACHPNSRAIFHLPLCKSCFWGFGEGDFLNFLRCVVFKMDLFSTFPSAPLSYGTYAVLGLMLALFALCLWGYARSSRLSKAEPKPNSRPEENRLANWLGLRDVGPWMNAALTLVMGIFGVLFILALIAITLILIETIFPFVTNEAPAVSLGLGTMFVALLGAPFVIWRSVVAQKTLDATMHGQVTDRINKAVEGLGAEKIIKNSGEDVSVPNMEVRIGSILALERIAKENLDFHIQVMEILCAYVRENSHLRPTQLSPHERLSTANPSQAGYTTEEAAERIKRILEIDQDTWEWKNELQCSNDIQAAITALGRRSAAQISVEKSSEPRFVFDLRKLH